MDLSPDIRARLRQCSEGFEQTALAKSIVSFTIKFQEPQMGQHHHLDLVAKDSTPLNFRIISRYITFSTSQESIFRSLGVLSLSPLLLLKHIATSFGSGLSSQHSASSTHHVYLSLRSSHLVVNWKTATLMVIKPSRAFSGRSVTV
ncbi:hypothetical protein D6D13_10193 [Aureobasidium pullulans]|uniref:Uncharacterized protein n=1 Tax=Aureobasidium pullulans TaxID=5580 RepID=A0A4S9C0K5_AURPU|nr:hypothetical protein D6D13_10193 [Aureobasidium pullulans]